MDIKMPVEKINTVLKHWKDNTGRTHHGRVFRMLPLPMKWCQMMMSDYDLVQYPHGFPKPHVPICVNEMVWEQAENKRHTMQPTKVATEYKIVWISTSPRFNREKRSCYKIPSTPILIQLEHLNLTGAGIFIFPPKTGRKTLGRALHFKVTVLT